MKIGIVYIYKEARTNNKNIEELAKLFFKETEDNLLVVGTPCQSLT